MVKTVAVIGAGASGITAARCLLAEGLTPTVYEQSSHTGGVWSFDDTLPEGGSPAYRSLHTNTPKQSTAFSDFPFPEALPDFPACAAVVDYLQRYIARHGIARHIQLNTSVEALIPLPGNRWEVRVTSPQGSSSREFDAVMVCSGMFHQPLLPALPGLASFPGPLLHSRQYIDATPFVGQTVLVIGTGSSGIDIAVETGEVARQTYMSGRNNAWENATVKSQGRPGAGWKARLERHLRLSFKRRGGAAQPDAAFVMQRDSLVISEKLRKAVASGAVKSKPGVAQISGRTVRFGDGSSIEADAIICATGYALIFPFLDEAIFHATPDGLALYRTVFPPDRPTLAFIGMSRATGAIMPLAEMQSRWVARIWRGKVKLPDATQMRAAVEARRALIAARNGNPFRIEFEPYMDRLAADIGALPRLWRHPLLIPDLLWGKPIAARYRLDGPGRSPNAAAMIKAGNRPPAQPATAPPTLRPEPFREDS